MRGGFEHVQSHPVEHVQSHPDNIVWKCHFNKYTMFQQPWNISILIFSIAKTWILAIVIKNDKFIALALFENEKAVFKSPQAMQYFGVTLNTVQSPNTVFQIFDTIFKS